MTESDTYAAHVEHPRYGKRPRWTTPKLRGDEKVFLHWHSPKTCRIPGTAIKADLARQTPATIAVTHYFDVERVCRDCGRPFIFFAEEQKHWYEDLGFGLDSDCVRCVPCRKKLQGIARSRERYEELFHVAERTPAQNLEMAECCLSLMEANVFHARQTQRVRLLLKRIREDQRSRHEYRHLVARLKQLDKKSRNLGC